MTQKLSWCVRGREQIDELRRLSERQQVIIGTPPSTHYEIAKVVAPPSNRSPTILMTVTDDPIMTTEGSRSRETRCAPFGTRNFPQVNEAYVHSARGQAHYDHVR